REPEALGLRDDVREDLLRLVPGSKVHVRVRDSDALVRCVADVAGLLESSDGVIAEREGRAGVPCGHRPPRPCMMYEACDARVAPELAGVGRVRKLDQFAGEGVLADVHGL